jgi:hypothetical protein
LWGWEPRRTTTHEYDERGRLVRSVETAEPEWDPESYALLAALADYEAELCPRCGEPLSECMDAGADPNNPRATHRYVGRIRGRCHACDALVVKQETDRKDDAGSAPIPRPESLHYGIDRVPIDRRPTRPGRR